MRRSLFGRLQRHLWVVCLTLQVCFFAWQFNQLQCLEQSSISSNGLAQEPRVPLLVNDMTKKDKQRNVGISSLRDQLALSSELIRAFPRLDREFPCFPAEENWDNLRVQQSPSTRGFLYVKARKAGSSTVAGVAIRIARSIAQQRNLSTPVCQVRFNHPMASKLQYSKRNKMESFLWSILREPTRRFMSEFFHFGLSRNFIQPTDEKIKAYMRETKPAIENYYLRWLAVDKPFSFRKDHEKIPSIVKSIINAYDFLGISERLDESLVALQMMLNLTTSDILYLSAKVNGGWDDGLYRSECYYISPSFVSESMRDFFQHSEEWYNFTVGDNLVYRAANASLDLTIESIGRKVFLAKLQKYRWALKKADEVCRKSVTFPCSPGGRRNEQNDCLIWDSACGMDCLDKFSYDFNL